ncbi:NAD-dependent epimerase/dehydratase family protein [Roseovarius sp. 2305UL8-3]|uniref:NAD-dependent epimerase/dehydratase family protein n=1 Tax=Roseovarius conchicola TaxID=3121636 RepID=UPI0035295997
MDRLGFIVTGATGFIGKAVTCRLRADLGDAAEIVELDSKCDLEDAQTTFQTFGDLSARMRCDHILHLAARAPSGVWLSQNPADALYSNTLINANMFEASRRYFPDAKITTTLSYSIYPPSAVACDESQVALGHPDDNLAAYASSKAAVLTAQTAYAQQYGLRSASVVLPTVYGFNRRDGELGQAIPSLCKKFLDGVKNNTRRIELWGDGYQERDYLYIDDAAGGIVASALHQTSPLINLGSGHPVSIRGVANRIAAITGFKGDIAYDAKRYSGPDRRWLNVEKARAELNWTSATSLDDGLQMTISKMKEGMENASAEHVSE